MEKVVAEGTWLYSGVTPKVSLIVQLDYDFWFAVGQANGDADPDEVPDLNPSGHRYYLRHTPWIEGGAFWPDGGGHLSIDEAMAAAEAALPGIVSWKRT